MQTPGLRLVFILLLNTVATLAWSQTAGTFYKHLRGTINNKLAITMDLSYDGTRFQGVYFYDHKRQPIQLEGAYEGTDIILDESVSGGKTGSFTGSFITGSIFSGMWFSADRSRSFAFSLVEAYDDGGIRLECHHIADKFYLFDDRRKEEDPSLTQQHKEILPYADGGQVPLAIRSFIVKGGLYEGASVTDKIGEVLAVGIESSHQEYSELKGEYEEGNDYQYSWTLESSTNVVMNTSGILCLEKSGYEYTGGAHGTYGSSYYVFDLKTGSRLNTTDIFKPGFEKSIQSLLEQKVRLYYEVPDDQPLGEALFEEEVLPNGNFYVNPAGVGFFYNIYEIAAYAMGPADIFFTWEEIMPYLKAGTPVSNVAKHD